MSDPLLTASWSATCRSGDHAACTERFLAEMGPQPVLHVCPCACHLAKPAGQLSTDLRAHFAAMGRRGGLKGGLARAASLTPEQRREIALKANRARWGKRA